MKLKKVVGGMKVWECRRCMYAVVTSNDKVPTHSCKAMRARNGQ